MDPRRRQNILTKLAAYPGASPAPSGFSPYTRNAVPSVYQPGQSPQEQYMRGLQADRIHRNPMASGAAESLGSGVGAITGLATGLAAKKADDLLGNYPSAGLKAVGSGLWQGADKLQRAIYGDKFIEDYNRGGGMAGAIGSALGAKGRKAAGEAGLILGDATALVGLGGLARTAAQGAGAAGSGLAQAGRQAGNFVKTEITNAADTLASMGPRPAYAVAGRASSIPKPPVSSAAAGGMSGGASGPVQAAAPLLMDATGRRLLGQYGQYSPEGARAVRSGRETTSQFLKRPEVQKVLKDPANPVDPKVEAAQEQFQASSGGYSTEASLGNTPKDLGYARRLQAGSTTQELINLTRREPTAQNILRARQLVPEVQRDLSTYASGRHVPQPGETAFPGLAHSSQVVDAASPQTDFLFRGNTIAPGQGTAFMSRHPDVAAGYATGRMYDGPTAPMGRMLAYPRENLVTAGEGPVMGGRAADYFNPAELFRDNQVDWRQAYLNRQTAGYAGRGVVAPTSGVTGTMAPTFEDIVRTDFGLPGATGEYAVRPTRLPNGMPGYAASTVSGMPASQMFAPFMQRLQQLLPTSWLPGAGR